MVFNENIEKLWQYLLENPSKTTKTVEIFYNSYCRQNYNLLGCIIEGI